MSFRSCQNSFLVYPLLVMALYNIILSWQQCQTDVNKLCSNIPLLANKQGTNTIRVQPITIENAKVFHCKTIVSVNCKQCRQLNRWQSKKICVLKNLRVWIDFERERENIKSTQRIPSSTIEWSMSKYLCEHLLPIDSKLCRRTRCLFSTNY